MSFANCFLISESSISHSPVHHHHQPSHHVRSPKNHRPPHGNAPHAHRHAPDACDTPSLRVSRPTPQRERDRDNDEWPSHPRHLREAEPSPSCHRGHAKDGRCHQEQGYDFWCCFRIVANWLQVLILLSLLARWILWSLWWIRSFGMLLLRYLDELLLMGLC